MMTDDDRAKMVEELRGRILFEWGQSYALDESSPTYDGTIDTTRRVRATLAADACLPIIEKLLAAHDLDALLDKTPGINALYRTTESVWRCVLADWDQSEGLGATPTAAIRAAVAAAKGGEKGEGE